MAGQGTGAVDSRSKSLPEVRGSAPAERSQPEAGGAFGAKLLGPAFDFKLQNPLLKCRCTGLHSCASFDPMFCLGPLENRLLAKQDWRVVVALLNQQKHSKRG